MQRLRDMLAHVVRLSGRVACVVTWVVWSEEVVRLDPQPFSLEPNPRWVAKNSWDR